MKNLKWITLTIVSQSVPYTASSKQDERTDITDSFGVSRPGVLACFVRLRHERLLDCWSAVAINRVLFLGSAGNVFSGFDIFIFEPWDSCKASSGREFTPAMATSNRRRNVSLHTFFFGEDIWQNDVLIFTSLLYAACATVVYLISLPMQTSSGIFTFNFINKKIK